MRLTSGKTAIFSAKDQNKRTSVQLHTYRHSFREERKQVYDTICEPFIQAGVCLLIFFSFLQRTI